MPFPKSDPGHAEGNFGHVDVVHLTKRLESLPKTRKRAGSATTFAYPLFETDFEEDGSESEYNPSRTMSPMSQTTSRTSARLSKASRSQNAEVDFEHASSDEVASRHSKQLQKRKVRNPVARSSPLVGRKKFAFARIKDTIANVEVQFCIGGSHIYSISGLHPTAALYGFLEPEMFGLGSHDQRIHKMRSDKDIILADSCGNAGRCQGCKNLIQVPQLYRWIEHKMKCQDLQSKLREELSMQGDHPSEVEKGPTADSGGNENDNSNGWSRQFEVEQNPMSPMKVMSCAFSQNELVSVRVRDKIEHFRYTEAGGVIRLDGKLLSEVFYGKKLRRGRRDRTQLFKSDPDIETFSLVDGTCVCRGCGQVVSIKRTALWLTHRLQCHVLQKHRTLPTSATHCPRGSENENSNKVSTSLTRSASTSKTSAPRPSLACLKRVSSVKRKQKEAFSSEEDGDDLLFAHSRAPKMRKQTHLNSEQSCSTTMFDGFELTTYGTNRNRVVSNKCFEGSMNMVYVENLNGAEKLDDLIQVGFGMLCRVTKFFQERFE